MASTWAKAVYYCKKGGKYLHNLPPTADEAARAYHELQYATVTWKDWQLAIIEGVRGEPDPRAIHWYYDTKGAVGKSFLAKYLFLKYTCLVVSGKSTDVFHQLAKMRTEQKCFPEIVIYDISRTYEGKISYGVLEKLKDGLVFSGKYEGATMLIGPVHVICFANFEPQYSAMSLDRWDVHDVTSVQ